MKRSRIKRGTKRLNPRSKGRTDANKEYRDAGPAFLAAHPVCEIQAPGCTQRATERSHIVGNGRLGGAGYTDPENWESACHNCGQFVEHEKAWSLRTAHHFHAWDYEPGQMRAKAIAKRAAAPTGTED